MKTKTATAIGVALVLTMGVAGTAFAHGKRGGGDRGAMMFEQLDTNGDGSITRAEADAAAAARFAAADADGNGLLSADEMAARAEGDRAERHAKRAAKMIEHLDANDDGQLSQEEMAARGPGKMFDRLDANEDGAISKEEMADARKGKGRRGHDKPDN